MSLPKCRHFATVKRPYNAPLSLPNAEAPTGNPPQHFPTQKHQRGIPQHISQPRNLNGESPSTFPNPEAAIASIFHKDKYVEWTSTDGDWNGDGIKDLAMILRQMEGPVDGPTQIRLVVLAGVPGGRYLPLSVSSSYCSAQKFYGLEAKASSLFVTAVHRMDEPIITETLHFRFNNKLGDFELIGTENVSQSSDDKSYSSHSVNYLAGLDIVKEKRRGRIKERKSRFAVPQLARLNGFDCDKYFYGISR